MEAGVSGHVWSIAEQWLCSTHEAFNRAGINPFAELESRYVSRELDTRNRHPERPHKKAEGADDVT
jgi:hypothetical protein